MHVCVIPRVVGQCCCVLVVFSTVYNYVCFSMLLLMGYFSMSLHMLFPQSTCVVFFGSFIHDTFPHVAV